MRVPMYPNDDKARIAKYSEKLHRCMKCGADATFSYYYLTDIPLVRCTHCGESTGLCSTPEEAIEKWNNTNNI